MAGINYHNTLKGRKPKRPSLCFKPGGKKSAHTFLGQHAIGPAINLWIDSRNFMGGQIAEIRFFEPGDSAVAAEPEIAVIIFENLGDRVVRQSFAYGECGYLSV